MAGIRFSRQAFMDWYESWKKGNEPLSDSCLKMGREGMQQCDGDIVSAFTCVLRHAGSQLVLDPQVTPERLLDYLRKGFLSLALEDKRLKDREFEEWMSGNVKEDADDQ